MALELDIHVDSDYIHVRAKGLRNRKGIVEITKKILGVCEQYRQSKVLVDVRKMKGRLGGLDCSHNAPAGHLGGSTWRDCD